VFIVVQILVGIGRVVLKIQDMRVSRLCKFGFKMPIHAQKASRYILEATVFEVAWL